MKRWAWIVVGILLVIILDKVGCIGSPETAADPSLLADRFWTESRAEDPRQFQHSLFLLGAQATGVMAFGSLYETKFWIVEWKQAAASLELHFLQEQKTERYAYRVRHCPGEAPEPMDLCLDLVGPKGQLRLYASSEQDAPIPEALRSDRHPVDTSAFTAAESEWSASW